MKINNALDCYSAVVNYVNWCETNEKTETSIYEILSFVKTFMYDCIVNNCVSLSIKDDDMPEE